MKKEAMKIPYMEILRNSFSLTWKNRYLWWFGFFVSLTGGGWNYNFPTGDFGSKKEEVAPEQMIDSAKQFIENYSEWLVIGLVLVGIICLSLMVLSIIGRGALIKSIDRTIKQEESSFSLGWSAGKKHFWRLLGLGFLLGIIVFFSLLIILIPSIVLFANKSYLLGGIIMAIGVMLLIVLFVLIGFAKSYGQIYLVLGELNISSSLENGYNLFRKNILASIIMALLFIPVGILYGVAILLLLIPFLLVFGLIGVGLYFMAGNIGVGIAVGVGLLLFLIAIFILSSAYQTFSQTAWILFFREIATPEEEEKVVEEPTRKLDTTPIPPPVIE